MADITKLSDGAAEALKTLLEQGRFRARDNIMRLYMVELKAFGLAEDPSEDQWELTELAKMKMGRKGAA